MPKKKFTKGIYYFNEKNQLQDYAPGQSFGYRLKAFYFQENNGSSSDEWLTLNPDKGFIEIEFISDSRIKGKFSCELIQIFPRSEAKKTIESTFDLPFYVPKNSQN